jgi:hypothetical protein
LALRLDQAAGASAPTQISGTLRLSGGTYTVADTVTNVVFTLTGPGLDKFVDQCVNVTGSGAAPSLRVLSIAACGKPAAAAKKNGTVKVKAEWTKYYQNLLSLRERLLNQMNGLAKESADELSSYSLHMADSGTDNFDRDFALSLLSSDQDAIYEIEEALKR